MFRTIIGFLLISASFLANADVGTGITKTPLFERQGYVVPWFSLGNTAKYKSSLKDAIATGANAIILDYMFSSTDSSQGSTVKPAAQFEVSLAAWGNYIKMARAMGLDVWVKPLVKVNGKDDWTGLDPVYPDQWFESYSQALQKMGAVAQKNGATAFIIGNELRSISGKYRDYWARTISEIRQNPATGRLQLTYQPLALAWTKATEEYEQVVFWDLLDFACIEAYPLLVSNGDNSVSAYKAGWSKDVFGVNVVQKLSNFIKSVGKDVYMTELGSFAVINGNFSRKYPVQDYVPYDLVGQASFFDASLQVLGALSGQLKGVFIYDWQADPMNVDGFVPATSANPDYLYEAYAWNLNKKPLADAAITQRFRQN